jgi:hypothetical protein
MQLDWLLNPVTFYSGATICLLTSLALFVSLKIEMARARAVSEVSEEVNEADDLTVRELKAEIERLRDSVGRLETVRPGQPRSVGIDLTRRAQVIRMHRRGEAVSSIAAALEAPANEIALLLKVHGMTNREEKAG